MLAQVNLTVTIAAEWVVHKLLVAPSQDVFPTGPFTVFIPSQSCPAGAWIMKVEMSKSRFSCEVAASQAGGKGPDHPTSTPNLSCSKSHL